MNPNDMKIEDAQSGENTPQSDNYSGHIGPTVDKQDSKNYSGHIQEHISNKPPYNPVHTGYNPDSTGLPTSIPYDREDDPTVQNTGM